MLGNEAGAVLLQPSLSESTGDGANPYEYVRSGPVHGGDQLGLFFSLPGMMMTAMEMDDMAADNMGAAYMGVQTGLGLQNHIDEASTHSVSFRNGTGAWAEDDSYGEMGAPDGPAVASGARLGPNQNRAVYNQRRREWNNLSKSLWKYQADKPDPSGKAWSPEDRARMSKGLSPEGYSVHHRRQLAHGGTNTGRNLYIVRNDSHQQHTRRIHRPPYPLPTEQSRNSPGWKRQ